MDKEMKCRNKWTQEQIDEIAKINSREDFNRFYGELYSVSLEMNQKERKHYRIERAQL